MAGNRAAAENYILKYVEKILPGGGNKEIYAERFKQMSDKEFEALIESFENSTASLAVIAPNFGKVKLSVERNLAIAEEIGHQFFERIWLDPKDGTPPYLSTVKYMVVILWLRRQAQLLLKKASIPENNKSVDDFTGQPTGASKGSKISYPETQILSSMNLNSTLIEMLKFRGGDTRGFNAMNASISRTGGVSLENISKLGTEVTSTRTLSTLLTAMHLKNSLL